MSGPVVILGLGFTTQRLARRLLQRHTPVYAAVRGAERFADLAKMGVRFADFPENSVLVHSVPPLREPDQSSIRTRIVDLAPRRILYISSTGVYGAQTHVNERTPAAPDEEKGRLRLEEESWLSSRAQSVLILRSAAIYGPGRGVHVRLREGKLPRGTGGVVSRIHVDDLAAILEAGIDASIDGAWSVADDCPAASEEVVAWCANRMGLQIPNEAGPRFPVSGRSVDAKRIRELLGVELKYPSYESGIEASLASESADTDRELGRRFA